jgi:hypothetical protein
VQEERLGLHTPLLPRWFETIVVADHGGGCCDEVRAPSMPETPLMPSAIPENSAVKTALQG